MNARILIVEDDALLALDLSDQLVANGFTVVGPAQSVAAALVILDEPNSCDAAVLDVNLGQETSEPIAHRLNLKGIPFLVISAYALPQHPKVFQSAPALTKPLRPDRLLAELRKFCK